MNKKQLDRVLIAPRISEKSMAIADALRQHVFVVVPSATKNAVRLAVEKMFEVKVERVNIVRMKGKRKGFGRRRGQRAGWKKAYVTLQEGYDIQVGGAE